jgi:hypothetical protein
MSQTLYQLLMVGPTRHTLSFFSFSPLPPTPALPSYLAPSPRIPSPRSLRRPHPLEQRLRRPSSQARLRKRLSQTRLPAAVPAHPDRAAQVAPRAGSVAAEERGCGSSMRLREVGRPAEILIRGEELLLPRSPVCVPVGAVPTTPCSTARTSCSTSAWRGSRTSSGRRVQVRRQQ